MSLKYLSLIFFCTITQPFTIMIDPTGDGQHTGREIKDTFERGITMQCAQQLKREILDNFLNIRVLLTRSAGEIVQPLHNAVFSNRVQPELYLRLGFYHEPDRPSHVSLFYYCQSRTDFWHKINYLQFYHTDQAHLLHATLTKALAFNFLQILQNNQINSAFVPYGLFAIPFKPFVGIQAPAIYIEAGLHSTNDWRHIINPIIEFIRAIVNNEITV